MLGENRYWQLEVLSQLPVLTVSWCAGCARRVPLPPRKSLKTCRATSSSGTSFALWCWLRRSQTWASGRVAVAVTR